MALRIHRQTLRVEWGECDPAGIVFYPNFLRMFDAATGRLFAMTGLSACEMRTKYGIIGLPLIEQGARFLLPCRFDDEIGIESFVEHWGRSSFTVRHRVLNKGALAVDGFEKRVWAMADPEHERRIRATPIPREIVAALSGESCRSE